MRAVETHDGGLMVVSKPTLKFDPRFVEVFLRSLAVARSRAQQLNLSLFRRALGF